MPEGDTIYRVAGTLRRALAGEVVTAATTSVGQVRRLGVQRLIGQTVQDAESRGKHMLLWFSPSELALHTHLRMSGSWHLYRRGEGERQRAGGRGKEGERWRKPSHAARFRVEVENWVAVCFSAPVIELLSASQVARHPSLAALGPDALQPDPDLGEALDRLDARAEWAIGDALLDQRVLAGIGNVFKNEVLFISGVDPWTPVRELNAETRLALLDTAVKLLRENADPNRAPAQRITTQGSGAALHVYGRQYRPCPRCGRTIKVARQGDHGRLTYWCQHCQGAGPGQ